MNEIDLKKYVEQGKSIAELAIIYNKSKGSIRHWLQKYNLTTVGKSGNKAMHTVIDGHKICTICNKSKLIDCFRKRDDRDSYSPYCKDCESAKSCAYDREVKSILVGFFNNKCNRCGLNKPQHPEIYDFHHIEPAHKDFSISSRGKKTPAQIFKELEKCVMLCANCHAKTHNEMKNIAGYDNKISGNTELWQKTKHDKLEYMNKCCCEQCGYDEYEGALSIIFTPENKQYRKYNKTYWDDDFKNALTSATVLCDNCRRNTQRVTL